LTRDAANLDPAGRDPRPHRRRRRVRLVAYRGTGPAGSPPVAWHSSPERPSPTVDRAHRAPSDDSATDRRLSMSRGASFRPR